MYKDDYGGTHMHTLAMCSEMDQDHQKIVDLEALGIVRKTLKSYRVDFLPTALIFQTRLFETNRFRKFVSDFCRDRGLNPIFRNHDPLSH